MDQACQKNIIQMARQSIERYLNTGQTLILDEKEVIDKCLLEHRACFVTLTIAGNLRGCVGHTIPTQSLYLDIIDNAINAGFFDNRFNPLTKEEFKQLKIEVSILIAPRLMHYQKIDEMLEKLQPNQDGVIIKSGIKQATYLPQVWQDLPNKREFLSSLCRKAGLPSDEWQKGNLEIQTYQVEIIK